MVNRRYMKEGIYSTNYPTDVSYLITPPNFVASAASRCVIFCHGHGGTGYQAVFPPVEQHTTALAAAGYCVYGIDHARINSWGDPDAMTAIDNAYTYITTTLGITNTKIGLLGWSMGGVTALNWTRRNPSKVSACWVFNPATDLRFFHDAGGAYTPTYSIGGATQGTYTAELDTTFTPTTAAVGAYTIPAVGGAGITITITTGTGKSFADGNNNGVVGKPQATTGAVAFTYTSKTISSLIGCVSTTAGTIAVANAQAITTGATYTQQLTGYSPWPEATSWTSTGVPIMVCQASDDVAVAPNMNIDGTNGWVAKVNDATNVKLRSPNPTGGHTTSVSSVPAAELVAWFAARL